MTSIEKDRDYVLGTHDEEIERLALQHRVWRPRVLDAWRRAGFTAGQVLLDVGCGPGWAALDLAEIAGPGGRVHAVDRSRRFLEALEANRARRGLDNVVAHQMDLDDGELPAVGADGAWARWVFAFVKRPREIVNGVREAMRPGGTLVLHEYFDYTAWGTIPRSAELEEFVREVVGSWRAGGGEPNVGLSLPRWLHEAGFEVRSLRPIVEVITPSDPLWQWPRRFIETGLKRLVDLGRIAPARAAEIARAVAAAEAEPATWMVTPGVLEILAVRR